MIIITFFTAWLVLAFVAVIFNYTLNHNNPRDDKH